MSYSGNKVLKKFSIPIALLPVNCCLQVGQEEISATRGKSLITWQNCPKLWRCSKIKMKLLLYLKWSLSTYLWGPRWFWLAEGWVKSDVELLPPAFVKTCFASSNIKCARASDGWLGTEGYARLPLNLFTLILGKDVLTKFDISWGCNCLSGA